MIQIYKIYVHTELHPDTDVFKPIISVKLNFQSGLYMGIMVKSEPNFTKLYTLISQYTKLIHAKFCHDCCFITILTYLTGHYNPSVSDFNQNQLRSSLGLIITNTIKKFQPLTHKTAFLILARFSGKMPLCAPAKKECSDSFGMY